MIKLNEDTVIPRKIKKIEKSKMFNYREYLDMNTDEEEFGVQETPEPEEESEHEPQKPIFTDIQINCLVEWIKDLTTLPGVSDADWSREVIDIVEEYFRNPAITVLTIFWQSKMLKALFQFPQINAGGLSYYLRAPWQIYTPENFLSTVIFGSIDGGVDKSMLSFMENIYAPIAFYTDDWPAVVKNQLLSNLHEFFMCLTDVTYNPMGLTMLYVPMEGIKPDVNLFVINNGRGSAKKNEISIGEARDENEEALIERLERVARCWTRQIRAAIKQSCTSGPCSCWKSIVDEIRYWHYRYENLTCVDRQLSSKSIVLIVEKLTSVRSDSVNDYDNLIAKVREKLNEAASNINYLNLLEKLVIGLDTTDQVDNYATKLLLVIKFVATESPFYNSYQRIFTLCRAFSAQVVQHFCKFINLNVILDGDAQTGKTILVECIDGCNQLSNTYDRLIEMDRTGSSPTFSLIEKSKVFNCVDTLINRCNDLILIVDARIAFDKSVEPIEISGPKGFQLGFRYRNIEQHFESLLTDIKNLQNIILDIESVAWLDHVVEFKKRLEDIDNMVKNFIDDVFDDVVNVEDGIEALHGIAKFSRRPYLRKTYHNKWIQIWKIFANQLDAETNGNFVAPYPSLSRFPERANILRGNAIFLTQQYKMLIDASDWFGDCDIIHIIDHKYNSVLAGIIGKENQLFFEWQKNIAGEKIKNISSLWNEPIIVYDDKPKIRTISVNTIIFHVYRVRECRGWNVLDYDAKNIFSKDCPKWDELQSRYNKIDYLCKFYNNIVANATRRERFTFSSILDDLEDALNCQLNKTNCFNDSFEIYSKRCLDIIVRIRESLYSYRCINWKLYYLIEKIGTANLASADIDSLATLENCDNYSNDGRRDGVKMVERNIKLIFKLLVKVKSIINGDVEEAAKHWIEYVNEIQEKLKNSFINCIRSSLRWILEFVRDNGSPMEISATPSKLQQAKLDIARINSTIFERALMSIEGFDEVFQTGQNNGIKIFLDSIDQDPRSNDLKKYISEVLENTKLKIQ